MLYYPYALVSASRCVSIPRAFDHYSKVKQTGLLPEGNDSRKRRRYSWTGDDYRKATERYHRRVVRPLLTGHHLVI